MGLILHDFETQQGIVLPNAYYKVGDISWNIKTNNVNCTLYLYASQEALALGKSFFPMETIGYNFIIDDEEKNDLENACYNSILSLIERHKIIEAQIEAYEADINNYIIEYDEEQQEISRTLIPNDELYQQRVWLPNELMKLLDAESDELPAGQNSVISGATTQNNEEVVEEG